MIRKTFEELKLTNRLPTPQGVGLRILRITQADDFSIEEIGHAIMADPALTGRLLKLANSVQSGSAEPIVSIADATVRLGVRAVRNVALGLSFVSANRSGACEGFDYERFWSMSLARAISAQSVSRRKRSGSASEAHVLGLLGEIGYLALASVYPREYSEILAVHPRANASALGRAERERFDIDHTEVGAYLLEEWGLPQTYCQALQTYEGFGRGDALGSDMSSSMAAVLWAAQAIAEHLMSESESDPATWARQESKLARVRAYLGLDDAGFLALCQEITREWVEWSKILQITDRLPVRAHTPADSTSGHAPAQSAGSPPKTSSLRILAVDDDAMSLKILERTLSKAGHQVATARDGKEALQIALETNPEVVIADWMMPQLDGIELCKSLRRIECGQDMFFLLLTGRGEEDRVVEAFDAGVDDYVVKPFNARILMARIKGGQRVIELKAKVEADRQTMLQQVAELGILTRKLRTAANTDVLTELPNRRYVMKRLEQEWEIALRTDKPLSVIMIDVDFFKKVNDVHGHDVGDVVLKETANVLRRTTRQGEEPARLGGEEFLVVCPGTDAAQAAGCAERLRAAIEANMIHSGDMHRSVTASLGVATRTSESANLDTLIKCADEAVYAAKNAGRNRVCVYGQPKLHAQSA